MTNRETLLEELRINRKKYGRNSEIVLRSILKLKLATSYDEYVEYVCGCGSSRFENKHEVIAKHKEKIKNLL